MLDDICEATGCNREQVIAIVGTALETLHKIAFCDETSVIRAIMECWCQFGDKACYHLGGLLEQGRLFMLDRDGRSWYETYYSASARWREFDLVVEGWMKERTEARKLLDAERPKTWGS
jgi:hypothetical protein